ncbi:MAG: outer membrane beta-barrel family protein [Muribaculaceae bacterium]|nr:outer membrane beta-barrel family protein [Muribaculaceae bacterium]
MGSKTVLLLLLASGFIAQAQTAETDSVKTQELEEVVVEGRNQRLGAEVSTYVPTTRQKNAAQTAVDLLKRMAIPQIRITPNDNITDLAGKSVDIFIDFLPASNEDLQGMRMQDVKRVEYYDFPSDPRFQGKAHVVNFVMQKYLYGGYVKAFGWENSSNAGQLSLYGKLQYKRMIFDVAAGGFYSSQKHAGADTYEQFRLPQADGTVKEFERNYIQDKGKMRRNLYWPTFKALYSTDRISMQNVIGASFDRTPYDRREGYVAYMPEISPRADFMQESSSRVNSLSYNGYWNFILNDRNTIRFSPTYAYSHTNSASVYDENMRGGYYNGALDDSHQFRGDVTYSHSFGKWGTLNAMLQTIVVSNNTSYSGTATQTDRARTYRVGPGVQYSLSKGKFYGLAGFGYHWNRNEFQDFKENSAAPWIDLSLQYSPNDRHSMRGEFHHMKSIPNSSYRSSAIIQSNPLMSYTGNPNLVAYGSYDVGLNYSFIPCNKFSLSAFASTWIVDNRYVYDYEPTPTGILRTIVQPGGGYSKWDYGVYASLRLLDRQLQLSAQLNANSVHNGAPNNYDRTHLVYAFQATYYYKYWNFSGIYYSPQGYSDGCMVGTWMKTKAYYSLSAGWSNSSWNINLIVANFARWNWLSDESEMHSRYYDKIERTYSINDHAWTRLSVTYTFGFGKKVEQGDEASQQSGAGSGILK